MSVYATVSSLSHYSVFHFLSIVSSGQWNRVEESHPALGIFLYPCESRSGFFPTSRLFQHPEHLYTCVLYPSCFSIKVVITVNCDQVCKRPPTSVASRTVSPQICSALILRHYLFRCFMRLLQQQLIMNSDKLMVLLSCRHRSSLISVPIMEGNFLPLLLSLKDGTQRVDIGMTDPPHPTP